jgi:hypothetical protein
VSPDGRRAAMSPFDPEDSGRPFWMEQMGVPLNGLSDAVLDALDQLGSGLLGWGRRDDEPRLPFFVDVGELRFKGATLRRAIGAARRGEGGERLVPPAAERAA